LKKKRTKKEGKKDFEEDLEEKFWVEEEKSYDFSAIKNKSQFFGEESPSHKNPQEREKKSDSDTEGDFDEEDEGFSE